MVLTIFAMHHHKTATETWKAQAERRDMMKKMMIEVALVYCQPGVATGESRIDLTAHTPYRNGRLPCPASLDLGRDSEELGGH